MSRTANTKKGKVCDYCDQPVFSATKVKLAEGGTMMVCLDCVGAVQQGDTHQPANTLMTHQTGVKSCGCVYDGETPSYCPDHDAYYCANCTGGRGECPVCDLHDAATFSKAELPHCQHTPNMEPSHCGEHGVWYCPRCHPICPKCQIEAVETDAKQFRAIVPVRSDMNPTHYPLVSCHTHGWYCSRCDKDCPSCNNRVKWEMPKCSHKSCYCSRCGLGCQGCGRRLPLATDAQKDGKHVVECPACKKNECRYCEHHKDYFCSSCDGNCLRCDGCYTKGSGMYHKCGVEMSHCVTHKKHFCLPCGQKCKLCVSDKKHRCGKPMSACKRHDRTFCPNCQTDCDDCKKEAEVAKNKMKHHCGCSMLFCAKHQLHFCPACDYLCNCSINCGIVEKYGHEDDKKRYKYNDSSEDVELQWADFQTWLKDKDGLLDAFKEFYENWHELMRYLYPKLIMCVGDKMAEEAGEKLLAVDTCFKDLYEIAARLGMKDAEEDEGYEDDEDVDAALNRAYGGTASYTDSDGRVHHFYNDERDGDCGMNNGTHYVNVVITDEGDDLSVGVKTTKFQSIVIDKK